MARLLALLWSVLLLCWPAAAEAPKLVVQTAGVGAFDAAGWTPDSRWVLEASGYERVLRIWDPLAGIVVDTIRLPLPGKRADEKITPDRIVVSADGRQAHVEAVLTAENDAIGETAYAALDYRVDLLARRAEIVPTTRDVNTPSEGMPTSNEGLAEIDKGRSVLPAAPDGTRIRRIEGGFEVLDPAGQSLREVVFESPAETNWASVSPDGSLLVFLSPRPKTTDESGKGTGNASADEEVVTQLLIYNIATGQSSPTATPWDNFGRYGRLGWTGDGRVLISEESSAFERDRSHFPDKKGAPAPGWLIDLSGDRELVEVDPGCFLQPLGPDRLVSTGLSNCRHGVKPDFKIWIRPLEGEWTELPVSLPGGQTVDALRASPDGRLLALSLGRKGDVEEIRIVDSVTGETRHSLPLEGSMITALNFAQDGRSLFVLGMRWAAHWRFAEATPENDAVDEMKATDSDPSLIVSDGRDLLFGGIMSPGVQHVRLGESTPLPPLDVVAPVAGGFLKDSPLFWVTSYDGELKLFDRRDWSLVATVRRFRNDDGEFFIVHDPTGRYDSDVPPDFPAFRWLMMDAPFQSLGPQTFMRELYTPDLLPRLIACVPDRSCDRTLPVATNLSSLNRTLPIVSDMEVRPSAMYGRVDVEVRVREGVNNLPSAAYGRATSGMHNVRLFRDGVMVREIAAADQGLDGRDLEGWRKATRLTPNMPDGSYRAVFVGVPLPSGPREAPFRFTAYAFNDDRVRGEEVEAELEPAAEPKLEEALSAARPRRLFALSIGVDAYPGGTFGSLRYAVADARAMADLFGRARIDDKGRPPMERVSIRIEGTAEKPATRAQIETAFATLRQAGPDDVVVISFSGHGYTDARGRFFLVPSDVRREGDRPVAASMIGADDLARWLAPVEAGAIHMVIDACHSAASVLAGGFKPGPMGDPGLGQLAYDKGMNILSASAPDQFAMEESELGHGLLTYALVVEGAKRGKADVPDEGGKRDGLVTIDELMAYAVEALPEIEARNAGSEGPGLIVEWAGPPQRRQTPRLFGFAAEWSTLLVPVGAP
jgi:hypothetical protein